MTNSEIAKLWNDFFLRKNKPRPEPEPEDEVDPPIYYDQEFADILGNLILAYNALDEIDTMVLSKSKADKLRAIKNKLFRSIEFYADSLSGHNEPKENE